MSHLQSSDVCVLLCVRATAFGIGPHVPDVLSKRRHLVAAYGVNTPLKQDDVALCASACALIRSEYAVDLGEGDRTQLCCAACTYRYDVRRKVGLCKILKL
jgi:hypothetical protein